MGCGCADAGVCLWTQWETRKSFSHDPCFQFNSGQPDVNGRVVGAANGHSPGTGRCALPSVRPSPPRSVAVWGLRLCFRSPKVGQRGNFSPELPYTSFQFPLACPRPPAPPASPHARNKHTTDFSFCVAGPQGMPSLEDALCTARWDAQAADRAQHGGRTSHRPRSAASVPPTDRDCPARDPEARHLRGEPGGRVLLPARRVTAVDRGCPVPRKQRNI